MSMEGTAPLPSPESAGPDIKDTLLIAAVNRLLEHFDSVQIIATFTKGTKTAMKEHGAGNWYARYGSMRYWVDKENEICRDEVREKGSD